MELISLKCSTTESNNWIDACSIEISNYLAEKKLIHFKFNFHVYHVYTSQIGFSNEEVFSQYPKYTHLHAVSSEMSIKIKITHELTQVYYYIRCTIFMSILFVHLMRKKKQNRCEFTTRKLKNTINKWNELISMTDHWARHIESVAQILHKIMIRFCSTEYISSFRFSRIRSPFPYRTSLTVEWILRSDIGINFNNNFIEKWSEKSCIFRGFSYKKFIKLECDKR